MRKRHPKNERIKRRYLTYLEEADRQSKRTTDQVAASLFQFENSTGFKDFAAFHIEQARKFKRDMEGFKSPRSGKPLAKATMKSRLAHVKAFFQWLAREPGYKSKIRYSDCDYFNLSARDTRIATATREQSVASAEQIRHVLRSMKADTDIEKRNRALIAFTFLTGARDDAIASLSLKHVDLDNRKIFQDARVVRTKNRKTITSWFFPVGEDVEEIVRDWVNFLVHEKLFGPDDPVFPSTRLGQRNDHRFVVVGLSRNRWSTAGPIRKIFKEAFESAGLQYFNPHSFRNTLVLIGEQRCNSPEEFKAWSQNLGHEKVMTAFTSYGTVPSQRQAEIMESLGQSSHRLSGTDSVPSAETIQKVLRHLSKTNG
ncbi:tyrosine-type recombinase/integrase [Roseibium aggregatum]|uniref:tyrosine-type recombinase/integrase n=1 Tax=Roseibium aggregatum TaxID=187304 RepID=UPI001E4B7311|nr:site-specific integrase [Roseibium aggregatum]UES36827.1 tyrosine-type recombinase/integrase [Roseibium aggregatum]